jgi:hypothetical protein
MMKRIRSETLQGTDRSASEESAMGNDEVEGKKIV